MVFQVLGKNRIAVVVILVVLVLPTALMVPEAALAIGPPPPILVESHFDLDTAKDFEKVGYLDPNWNDPVFWDDVPVFVLRRGTTGTINITVSSSETNKTVTAALGYGWAPPFDSGWSRGSNIPDGITYSIEPANMTLAPNSTTTVIMRISAAPGTPVRDYKLTVSLNLEVLITGIREGKGYRTVLTIVEGVSPINTTSVEKATTSYVTETATLTSTATTTTLIEGVAEPAIYAWAISATTITAVLAVVLLRRRR